MKDVLLRNPSDELQLANQGKDTQSFRIYKTEYDPEDLIQKRVHEHYIAQHTNQTVDFVKSMHDKWLKFDHGEMGIIECLRTLNSFVDNSDPDVDVANSVHAYQTAERIREAHPDKDWFHLIGLIHDLGKVMCVWGEHQWATTGDTYPVGCRPGDSVVHCDTSFENNPDQKDARYTSKLGIYEEGCGLDKLMMTWGHDEYMYQVLKNHPTCTIPEEGLYQVRFHSFYPWHTGRDYTYFENDTDKKMYPWLMEMNKFDLYSKGDALPDMEKLEIYYQGLIDKYVPGLVKW